MRRVMAVLTAGFLVAAATPFLAGSSVAQTAKPATAPVTTQAAQPKARLHTVIGEVVAADAGARTLTMKAGRRNPKELTFAVEDKAASALAGLHPGDRVRVRYIQSGEKLDALVIVKTVQKGKKT